MFRRLKIYLFKHALKKYIRRVFGRINSEQLNAVIDIVFEMIDSILGGDKNEKI